MNFRKSFPVPLFEEIFLNGHSVNINYSNKYTKLIHQVELSIKEKQ